MIKVLYTDVESLLKVNGGLCTPFKVERGVRQGCCLSGMLYSIAIEPLLQQIRSNLSGVQIAGSNCTVHLSAYANDLIVMVKCQRDIDILMKLLDDFKGLSSGELEKKRSCGLWKMAERKVKIS